MQAMDFTLNNMTARADARRRHRHRRCIVVLENLFRYVEEARTPFDAAIRHARCAAVITTTLSRS